MLVSPCNTEPSLSLTGEGDEDCKYTISNGQPACKCYTEMTEAQQHPGTNTTRNPKFQFTMLVLQCWHWSHDVACMWGVANGRVGAALRLCVCESSDGWLCKCKCKCK